MRIRRTRLDNEPATDMSSENDPPELRAALLFGTFLVLVLLIAAMVNIFAKSGMAAPIACVGSDSGSVYYC